MTNEALVSGWFTTQCAIQSPSGSPLWLQIIQAAGGVATAIGVLIALYVTVIRDPREASEEHRHHVAEMDALHQVRSEKAIAQARGVVPSCLRRPVLGDSWWTVRIDNTSHGVTTIHSVRVTAVDANGVEVPDGCEQSGSLRTALSESVRAELTAQPAAGASQAIRDAVTAHFVTEWPRVLPPNQYVVTVYTTTDPSYQLRIAIEYEDEAGYLWHRTDVTQPRRSDLS